MKKLIPYLFIFILVSCGLKNAADNGFKTKTKLEPMAPSKTLTQRFGNKIIVKIPITEDSVGYYDIEEVLGNSELDSRHKSLIRRFFDDLKLKAYNFFVKLGRSNKMKFSSVINFPKIDTRYIKSAKVKKVFFTTEDCRPEEENCNTFEHYGSNFNLVDTFFINVSSYAGEDNFEYEITELNTESFKKQKIKAFKQTKSGIIKSFSNAKNNNLPVGEVNLVKFYNNIPALNLDISSLTGDEKFLHFNVKKNINKVGKYLEGKKFKHLIKEVVYGRQQESGSIVRYYKKGVDVYLHDHANAQQIFDIINQEKSSLAKRMFIFRLNKNLAKTKQYFEADRFKHLIKDSKMIGRSLFVEIHDEKKMDEFKTVLNQTKSKMNQQLGIYKIDRCIRKNCLDLEVKDVNLIPLIQQNSSLKIDTYLSVKTLGNRDFKYNGYIEVEIGLDIPL